MMALTRENQVNNGHRTKHYRTLAGHFRLWAEGESSSNVTEELLLIAARLDQLAARVDAARVPGTSHLDQADSLVH